MTPVTKSAQNQTNTRDPNREEENKRLESAKPINKGSKDRAEDYQIR